jgi:DNA-binding NarL/FixJ family response regulator
VGEFRRLDALVDNVRAALDWTEVNDARLNLVIAARFGWYWLDDKSREGLARLRATIPASPDASPDLAMALIIQARIVDRIDGPDAASHVAMEAARMARVLGDPDLELLAVALALPANRAAAPEQASRIRKLLGSVEDPVSRFIGLTALAGAVQDDSGVTDEVIEILQGAAAAVSGTSYRRPQGMAAAYMAEAFIHGQQPSEAYRYSSNALSALREGGPHTRSWILTIHAIAASGAGHNGEAAMSLRSAIEVAPDRHASSFVGVMLAAVVVLTAWGSPHRAAMTCGLIDAVTSFDPLPETEAAYWDRLLAAARRAADPVAFEIAFREGQKAGVDQVINEVLAHLDAVEASPAPAAAVRLQHGTLTTREVEVLTLVGAGRSDAEIAAALYISPKTASVHVSNAKAKLGVETRLEAALWARDRGLVDGEPDA